MDAKRTAARSGMTKFVKIYRECLIGYCPGIYGLCVVTEKNGIRGHHIPTVRRAIQFIDENIYGGK